MKLRPPSPHWTARCGVLGRTRSAAATSAPCVLASHSPSASLSAEPHSETGSATGIQQGKRYDLNVGEGARVLRDCMERATGGLHYWNVPDPQLVAENFARYGAAVEVHPRLGQGLFRVEVADAYQRACAVTGEHSLPALEAAHILPYGQGGEHRVDNGLLLRSDLHRLYDRGYATVTPDYVFRVSGRLRDDADLTGR
jgi:HNH endonuclease